MADYKTLKGFKVRSVASDPTVDLGQLWYNTASSALKYDTLGTAGAWSTGGDFPEGGPGLAGGGSQTAAFAVGGGPSGPYKANMSLYNGTAWTEVTDCSTATDYLAACGTPTAAFKYGGNGTIDSTELFNGTAWTAGGAMNTGVQQQGGYGVVTAAISCAGLSSVPNGFMLVTQEYNGVGWADLPSLNTGRKYMQAGGTSTSGICGPGATTGATVIGNVEIYNGTSWSAATGVGTASGSYGMAKQGTNTASLIFAGNKPASSTTLCEQWNGTGWTEVADVSVGTQELTGAGVSTGNALKFGGNDPGGYTESTEEWAGAAPALVKTVTVS